MRHEMRATPGDETLICTKLDHDAMTNLVYRSDGALYFTDPPFGLPEGVR